MISIIIPTLEEEKMIGRTLSLLKSQLTIPHEIIVSDGGSKDKTVEIATKLADKVVVYEKKSRQTIAQGRNDGAKVAQGDFFVFTDADCVIPEPDAFFRSALSRFQSEPRLVALTSHFRFFPEDETFSDRVVLWSRDFAVGLQNNVFRKGDCAGGEFQMVRKDAFVSIGGYREDLVTLEDRDLFIRLAKIGRTMSDPKLVVFHSGRRAHSVGWPRLIGMFFVNMASFYLRGRLLSKEWKPVR
jgi:glycosyltransferase involved in cell wall biosynthesis